MAHYLTRVMDIEWKRLCCALMVACSGYVQSLMAHDNNPWISINGHEAHPTKILARLKADFKDKAENSELSAVLKFSNSQVVRQYRKGLNGLLLLDQELGEKNGLETGSMTRDQKAEVLKERIRQLESSGLFEYVQPNFIRKAILDAADPAYVDGRLWGLDNDGKAGGKTGVDIDVDLAWDSTIGSKGVVVAVIDSGIRYTHQDLAGNMWTNPGEVPDDGIDNDLNGIVDDIHGFNAVLQNGDPLDVIDHGTNVASVIGATSDDKDVVGVAQEVSLMACKALTEFGGEDADLVASIEYAVIMGADIINASWGNYSYSQAIFDAIAMAQGEGILFVAGAGNDASNNDVTPFYPASHDLDNILSVASFDKFDLLSDHSNYGIITVDIAAPGSEIYMAGSGDEAGAMGANVLPDEDYDYADGTSFAAPHVTGVAVLLKSLYPDLLATELKEMILSSAVKTPALAGKVATEGRLNAYNALQVQPDGLLEVSINPPSGSVLLTGESQIIEVRVTDIVGIPDSEVLGLLTQGETLQFINDGSDPDVAADDAIYTASVVLSGLGETSMQIVITHPDFPPVTAELHYTLVERPKNDDFSRAQKIEPEGGAFVTYSKFAGREEVEPDHAGLARSDDSLWWKWYPAVDSNVIIDTAGSDFDTIIAVYQGEALDSLTEVGAVDDSFGRKAGYLNFHAIAGECYYIAVSAYGADKGASLRLRVEPEGQPDWIEPVVSILQPGDGLVTTDPSIALAGYAFDPEPNASGVKSVFIRVNGEMVGGGASGLPEWYVEVFLMPGLNRIEVSAVDWANNRSEVVGMDVRFISYDPPNDHLHQALPLDGNTGQVSTDNSDATKEMQEPYHAGNMGGRSLWYQFKPESDGKLTLMTRRTQVDTLIALYEAAEPINRWLREVISNDDVNTDTGTSRIDQAVRAGHTYYLALDGFCGESGSINLSYVFEPMNVYEVVITTQGEGHVAGTKQLYFEGEALDLTAIADHGYQFDQWGGLPNSQTSAQALLTLPVHESLTFTASFSPDPPTENFEDTPFKIGGLASTDWILTNQGYLSDQAMASGSIADGGSSRFGFSMNVQAGLASFFVKTSCEEDWDKLVFKLDGKTMSTWSGETAWQRYEFVVSEGLRRFEWIYTKDSFASSGSDKVYLDDIDLPLETFAPSAARPASVFVRKSDEGQWNLEVEGFPETSYSVEVSKGLHKWQQIHQGVTDSTGRMTVRNVMGQNKAQSFYRAVTE